MTLSSPVSSFDFSHDKISLILPSMNTARWRFISGVTTNPRLIHKLVQSGKVVPSCGPNEICIDQLLIV